MRQRGILPMVYSFIVNGYPVTKSNFKPKTKAGYSLYGKKYKEYEKLIQNTVIAEMVKNDWKILSCNVQMLIFVYKGRNAGDLPNYQKSICDSLNKIVYEDDKQIKLFCLYEGGVDKQNPRIEILISPLDKYEYIQCGNLVKYLPKNIKSVSKKEEKKTDSGKVKNVCPDCWGPLTSKKGHIGKHVVDLLICKKCLKGEMVENGTK